MQAFYTRKLAKHACAGDPRRLAAAGGLPVAATAAAAAAATCRAGADGWHLRHGPGTRPEPGQAAAGSAGAHVCVQAGL
eukprot:362878-Chlamydomonas_euryale.AAC.2